MLVLIHGGYSSLHSWDPWIPFFSQDYRVLRVDVPAHGLTGRIPSDVYTRGSMVALVHEFLQALNVERFAIAGHSMGGGIVLTYALNYPAQVEAMILIGPEGVPEEGGYDPENVFVSAEQKEAIRQGNVEIDTTPSLMDKITGMISNAWLTRKVYDRLVYDPAIISDERIERGLMINRYEEVRYARLLMNTQYLAELVVIGPRDLEPRLHEVQAPTLIINGDQDILVPPATAKKFHQGIPNSELIIYKNMGHLPPQEKPAKTAQDVIDFLSKQTVGK